MCSLKVYDFTKNKPLVRLPTESEVEGLLSGSQLRACAVLLINEEDSLSYYCDGLTNRELIGALEELKVGLLAGGFSEGDVDED